MFQIKPLLDVTLKREAPERNSKIFEQAFNYCRWDVIALLVENGLRIPKTILQILSHIYLDQYNRYHFIWGLSIPICKQC
jgi:hypothetical protein